MRRSAFEERQILQLVYDSVDAERGFGPVLEALGKHLNADKGQVLLIERGGQLVAREFYGGEQAEFAGPSETRSESVRPPADSTVDTSTCERTRVYNDFLAPLSLRYTLYTNIDISPRLTTALAFMRPLSSTPFDAQDSAGLQAVIPHLCRAAQLRHALGSLRRENHDLRQMLDAFGCGVALMDGSGKVLHTNRQADAVLREPGGLRTQESMLYAPRAHETAALSAALAEVAQRADSQAQTPWSEHVITVPISLANGAELCVVLLPLRSVLGRAHEALRRSAHVFAIFHDPRRRTRLEPRLVAKIHGLTATEAILASAIAEGKTLAEFAAVRGCAEQTARTHLKRVLEKTGTTRQADLVRVLLTGHAAQWLQR